MMIEEAEEDIDPNIPDNDGNTVLHYAMVYARVCSLPSYQFSFYYLRLPYLIFQAKGDSNMVRQIVNLEATDVECQNIQGTIFYSLFFSLSPL